MYIYTHIYIYIQIYVHVYSYAYTLYLQARECHPFHECMLRHYGIMTLQNKSVVAVEVVSCGVGGSPLGVGGGGGSPLGLGLVPLSIHFYGIPFF